MADLLSLLFSFQPDAPELKSKREYDVQARRFIDEVVRKVSAQSYLRGADTAQDVLELLNPAVNTIAYAYALLARIQNATDNPKSAKAVPDNLRPGGTVWNKITLFLETADPVQLRYLGTEWKKLLRYVEQVARLVGTPALAIAPMRSGLTRLDPTTGTFTSLHLDFIRLCMETRSYAAAAPILDNYIHSLPSTIPQVVRESLEYSVPAADLVNSGEYIHSKTNHSDKVTILDFQEYYLLGASAYIGQREYKKAKQFLEHILVVPSSNVANGLMLEAYKRWLLTSCLVDGEVKGLPRTINQHALKALKGASRAYEALGEAFAQLSNLPKLRAQINAGTETWAEDGNTGLVNELAENQFRFYVSRLSGTYSAIPVSKVAGDLGGSAEQVTAYIETLIAGGLLNARIERPSQSELGVILRFFLDPTQGPLAKTEKQQQQALLEQTERTNTLAAQVKSADYRLGLSREYMEHLKRQQKKAAGSGSGDAMDMQFDDHIDEDIMGDLS